MTDTILAINDLRRRVLAGEQVTREELSAAIQQIRLDRETTSAAKKAKTEAATKPTVALPADLNDLFK